MTALYAIYYAIYAVLAIPDVMIMINGIIMFLVAIGIGITMVVLTKTEYRK